MRTLLIAVLAVVLAAAYGVTGAVYAGAPQNAAAPTGNVEAGKGHWALGNTSCRNCHGGDGEGAFGPPLAGRNLTYERFRSYVRNPAGRMPGYAESQLTDQEIADMTAYFDSLPPVPKPGAWRIPLPAGAPRGQQLAIAVVGCGQCHGATFETPRHGMAEVNGEWEWFKRMVYQHTAAQPEQWGQFDPAMPRVTPSPAGPPGRNRVRMGNYSPARLPESLLKEMYDWAMDLGPLAPLTARITAGTAGGTGATYEVTVLNAGVKNKGMTVEDITVAVALPPGSKVADATGTGYEGVRPDAEGTGNVALWRIPRLAATESQTLKMTLSAPASTLRGTIRWGRPAVKADEDVTFQLATGRGGRGGI